MIHDSNKHLGENWPNFRAIERRIKLANEIIVFSEHIGRKLIKYEKNISVFPLPGTFLWEKDSKGDYTQALLRDIEPPRILFIGRIHKYKGLDILISAYSKGINGTLVIAGDGEAGLLPENVVLINRWLSDFEFNFLVEHADLLVFHMWMLPNLEQFLSQCPRTKSL
jgi:glycosyltransferase involved in cell wall biosynthesis